jgi:predicted DNA-binding protein (MmcQ/YjbR family)
MTRQDVFEYCRQQYGTEPDYPWKDWSAVLRHKENNKWYAVILEVGREKLGLPGDGVVDVMNVKCNPILSGSLRCQPGYFPAYHMNKEQWLSILLEGPQSEDEIRGLLDLSFRATAAKKK